MFEVSLLEVVPSMFEVSEAVMHNEPAKIKM